MFYLPSIQYLSTKRQSSFNFSAPMAAYFFFFFFLLFLLQPSISPSATVVSASPYLSPTTLFPDYQNMLTNFKIYIYNPINPFNFPDAPTSVFYNTLLRSSFLTHDPAEAHLFFVPFSPGTSTRSLARIVRDLRSKQPFWNRTLGADHFFVSPSGIDYSSDRNVLELKKNAVQVSVFPVTSGYFIPHKDITLPPSTTETETEKQDKYSNSNASTTSSSFLGYMKWDGKSESKLVNEMKEEDEFFVDEKSGISVNNIRKSKFCLLIYNGEAASMVEAMGSGCVPVLIVSRPIQDLPLMDVLRWSDMALLVSVQGGGIPRLKEVLRGVSEEKYLKMKELCIGASKHLVWHDEPQPLDAFHMVMYQLWSRRHAIRYSRRDPSSV